MKSFYITNSRGEKELYSSKKLYRSCKRVGVSNVLAKKICKNIEKEIYPGMKTSEIYKLAKQFLSSQSPKSSIRFSLKEAMRKLGPDGFNFEKYIGELFSRNGFSVETNQNIPGDCISSYEIDFLAEKKNLIHVGESKYHQATGRRVDLKVALYNYARFLDISNGNYFRNSNIKSIIVTNTKFTSEVIKYSKCMKVDLLGWRYPVRNGLEQMIEKLNFYPITILPSFTGYFKKIFAEQRMMLALDILEHSPEDLARKLSIPLDDLEKLIEEAKILLVQG